MGEIGYGLCRAKKICDFGFVRNIQQTNRVKLNIRVGFPFTFFFLIFFFSGLIFVRFPFSGIYSHLC